MPSKSEGHSNHEDCGNGLYTSAVAARVGSFPSFIMHEAQHQQPNGSMANISDMISHCITETASTQHHYSSTNNGPATDHETATEFTTVTTVLPAACCGAVSADGSQYGQQQPVFFPIDSFKDQFYDDATEVGAESMISPLTAATTAPAHHRTNKDRARRPNFKDQAGEETTTFATVTTTTASVLPAAIGATADESEFEQQQPVRFPIDSFKDRSNKDATETGAALAGINSEVVVQPLPLLSSGEFFPIAEATPVSDSQINQERLLLEQRNMELEMQLEQHRMELERQRTANYDNQHNQNDPPTASSLSSTSHIHDDRTLESGNRNAPIMVTVANDINEEPQVTTTTDGTSLGVRYCDLENDDDDKSSLSKTNDDKLFERNRRRKRFFVLVGFCVMMLVGIAVVAVGVICGGRSGTCQSKPTITTSPPARRSDEDIEFIRLFINSITLTGRTIQYPSMETAEERALQWLIDDDHVVDESTTTAPLDQLSLRQRYVLATLWFQAIATSGPFVDVLNPDRFVATWTTPIRECEWYKVQCDNVGRVIALRLENFSLQGHIPDDLGLLSALTSLDMDSNQLTGTIPSSLDRLTALKDLELSRNVLTGTIPSSLEVLTALTSLWLIGNRLTGTIPSSLVGLTELTGLRLWGNHLTGTVPFCSFNHTFTQLVADCNKVICPCCTHCCPFGQNGIQSYEFC